MHDLGKVLCLYGEPQWAVVGDTFPVGCAFSPKVVFSEFFAANPDSRLPQYQTKLGVYEEGCGLDKVDMSWGHDEYIYHVAKDYLPEAAGYMLRYHSFYPAHLEGEYQYLMNDHDQEMFKWVREFSQYDLYSKSSERPDAEKLRPYYEDPFLGLKPLGALSLSLAFSYFGFIGLFLLVLSASPGMPPTADVIGVGGFLSGLVLLGLVLFFLPLRGLHRRMVEQKRQEMTRLRPKLGPIYEERAGESPLDVAHLVRIDMMDRKVTSMAIWPYDVGILGRLSAITLSVTAILISRIIALVFHI